MRLRDVHVSSRYNYSDRGRLLRPPFHLSETNLLACLPRGISCLLIVAIRARLHYARPRPQFRIVSRTEIARSFRANYRHRPSITPVRALFVFRFSIDSLPRSSEASTVNYLATRYSESEHRGIRDAMPRFVRRISLAEAEAFGSDVNRLSDCRSSTARDDRPP
jgi:hypothetical protein